MKVIGSASFRTVDVLADGTGLSSRAGSALLALTAQRLGLTDGGCPGRWPGLVSVVLLMIRGGFCVIWR